jgi:hypothetical protein
MILCSLLSINHPPTKLVVDSAAAPPPHRVWQKKLEQKPDSFWGMKNHYLFFTIYQSFSLKTAGHVIDSLHLSGQLIFL